MVVLSVSRVNGRLNGVFVAERRRIRLLFLVNREWLYEIAKQEVKRGQKKTPEDRSIGSANQKRFQKIRTSDGPSFVLSNHITLAGHILRTHLHMDQLPFRPIRSFGRTSDGPSSVSSNQILRTDFRTDFRRTIFRLVQSDPSDAGLTYFCSLIAASPILATKTCPVILKLALIFPASEPVEAADHCLQFTEEIVLFTTPAAAEL